MGIRDIPQQGQLAITGRPGFITDVTDFAHLTPTHCTARQTQSVLKVYLQRYGTLAGAPNQQWHDNTRRDAPLQSL